MLTINNLKNNYTNNLKNNARNEIGDNLVSISQKKSGHLQQRIEKKKSQFSTTKSQPIYFLLLINLSPLPKQALTKFHVKWKITKCLLMSYNASYSIFSNFDMCSTPLVRVSDISTVGPGFDF